MQYDEAENDCELVLACVPLFDDPGRVLGELNLDYFREKCLCDTSVNEPGLPDVQELSTEKTKISTLTQ